MNLDNLIDLVDANRKASGKKKHAIEKSYVRKILEDANIGVLLNQESPSTKASRLVIRRVSFRGRKWQEDNNSLPFHYDRELRSGVNAWVASNSCGKSTVLKVITWAFTGIEPALKGDVAQWLEEAAVEIEVLDDGIYTIQYFIRPGRPRVTGKILRLPIEKITAEPLESAVIKEFTGINSMTAAVAEFLGPRFGFQGVEWVESKRYDINLYQKAVSWEVYSQAMFLGSDDYSDFLFPDRKNWMHHRNTLSAYLKLDLLKAVAKLEKLYREAHQEHQLEDRRVKANAKFIVGKIQQLKQELDIVNARIEGIDTGHSAVVDVSYASQVNEQVSRLTERRVEVTSSLNKYISEERQLREEQNVAKRQAQEMRESIQFKLYISGLEVERCPLCEASIPIKQQYTDLDDVQCRVCHNPLQKVQDTNLQERYLKESEERIAGLQRDLRKVKRRIASANNELSIVDKHLSECKKEYEDLSRQQRAGFTSELRELLNRQGHILGQIEELQQFSPESQSEHITRLKDKRDVLQAAKAILQNLVSERSRESLDLLQEKVTELALKFRVMNVQEVFLNRNLDLFTRQSGDPFPFQKMELGEKLRLKIAFHLALLELRLKENIGRHPGLLIIDAPGGAEMTDDIFSSILDGICKIDHEYGNKCQILVASTRDEMLQAFTPERIEYKPDGETLF